jgi:hypothetical protein
MYPEAWCPWMVEKEGARRSRARDPEGFLRIPEN